MLHISYVKNKSLCSSLIPKLFRDDKSANFIKMRNGCHQRGHSSLEKYRTFEFSPFVDFYAFYLFVLDDSLTT